MRKLWSALGKVPKVIILIVVILLVILIALSLLSGSIAKWYIEKHDKELIGREIQIEKIYLSPLCGKANIKNLSIYESDDITPFVSLSALKYRMSIPKLLSKCFKVKKLEVDSLYVHALQNGDKFNFSDILDRFSSEEEKEKDTTSSGWTIDLNNLDFVNNYIIYEDAGVGSRFGFNHLNINVPRIYLGGEDTDAGIKLNFDRGGSLAANIAYNMDKSRYNLHLVVEDFSLEGVLPYLKQFLNLNRFDGTLAVDIELKGETEHVMNVDVAGSVITSGIVLYDQNDEVLASLDTADILLNKINLQEGIADIGHIYLVKPQGSYILYKDSTTNFSSLFIEGSDETTEEEEVIEESPESPSKEMQIALGSLRIRDGRVSYIDYTLPQPFEYSLSEISFKADNLSVGTSNRISGGAVLGQAGKVTMNLESDFKSLRNLDLRLSISNLDIRDFTPYSYYYVGNNIENGLLGFVSRNTIRDNKITGNNKLEIIEPQVSKRVNKEPQYKLPVRLAVYILTDKNGVVSIDLPVSGDLDNPKFSYTKIIWKTLGNLLVKVGTAPFTSIANLFSGGGDAMADHIAFDDATPDFDTQGYSELDALVQLALDKPELTYSLTQQFDLTKRAEELSELNLRRAYYNGVIRSAEDTTVTTAISSIDIGSAEVEAFADSLLTLRGIVADGNITEKAVALFGNESEATLLKTAELRNQNLRSYFERMETPENLFKVATLPVDSLRAYSGKALYTISAEMGDDEDYSE